MDESATSDGNSLVVCFGEMLIDFVPTVNGTSLAEAPAFKKAPGGAPANVAVGIARLGGSSAFIGKVGADEFGYMLADILKQNNVNNSGMRFDPTARTALAFVTLRDDGEREFLFFRHPSADMLLHESELDVNLIKQAKIFHYGSISLIEEPSRSAHLAAMAIAKESGSFLSYDPNLRLPLWPSEDAARKGIMSIWDQADVIKISEDEISFLTDGADPNDDNVVLEKLFHPNLKLLLVSEGSKGCRYYTKQFKGMVPSIPVKAIDTTGAGDAFVGGLLYNLACDVNLYQFWRWWSDHRQNQKGTFLIKIKKMGSNGNTNNVNSLLLPEIGPDGLMREAPVIAYTEKIIEEEQLQLKKYIQENYTKIRDVERELANLSLEMKLTAGPKKAALEHMRKKIELSTESIRVAKVKEEQARKVWEAALKAVKDEEAIKQKLCEDLNSLVQESSNTQFARLEELKRRIENLNPSRSSTSVPCEMKPVGPAQISPVQDASSVPSTLATTGTESNPNHGNGENAGVVNSHNTQPSAESEGREKKKIQIQGRVKGIGAVPKGRGPTGPGWTGAGFDVDGKN